MESSASQQNFWIQGTVAALGGVIDMTVYATDFTILNTIHFFICIETAAPIIVQLEDGSIFTITAVQATSYLGKWYPARLIRVYKIGTTGNFSFGY
jgi:hypothetical protein